MSLVVVVAAAATGATHVLVAQESVLFGANSQQHVQSSAGLCTV
jgi:hypothetical protein